MSKRIAAVCLCLILCLAALNFMYWSGQKEGIHCDEAYTYGLANYEEDFFFETYKDSANAIKWNTPADIDKYLTASEEHRFEYDTVYYNQINDVHPPLYYIIVHTISSLFPGSSSYYIGIIPNILFTLGTCLLLYLITMRILKKRYMALLAVIFYTFSVNSVNMVIYIRMYAMLTFFTTAVIYLHLILADNGYKFSKASAALMILTVFLGAYTQYYFLIFLFAAALFNVLIMLAKKEYKKMFTYAGVMASSGILYLAAWPTALNHIFNSGRGVEAFDNASNSSALKNAVNYIDIFKSSIGENMIELITFAAVICIIFIVVPILKNKKLILSFNAMHKHIFMCAFTTVVYFFVIAKVAPYQTDRYIAPVFPLICMICIMIMCKAVKLLCSLFSKKEFKQTGAVVFAALIICLGINMKSSLYDYEASPKGYNYLYRMSEENRKNFEENSSKKCIMINTHESHFLFNFPDYKNYSKTAFVSAWEIYKLKNDPELKNEKEIIVYINDALNTDKTAKLLCEKLGFDDYELLVYSNARNWANIYKIIRN